MPAPFDWAAVADLPVHALDGAELDDLELALNGALPGPPALDLNEDDQIAADGSGLVLTDPQGTPLALLGSTGLTPLQPPAHGAGRGRPDRPPPGRGRGPARAGGGGGGAPPRGRRGGGRGRRS